MIYFVCVLFPIIIINLVFYKDIEVRIKKEKTVSLGNTIEQIKEEIEQTILEIGVLTNSYYVEKEIYEIIDRTYLSQLEFLDIYQERLKYNLFKDIPYYKQIQAMAIYTDNPTVLNSGGVQMVSTNLLDNEIFSYNKDRGDVMLGNRSWISTVIGQTLNKQQQKYLSIYRNLDKYKHLGHYKKILRIDINYNVIQDMLMNDNLEGDVYLVNEIGNIIVATNSSPIVTKGEEFDNFGQMILKPGQFIIERNSAIKGWKIVGVFNESQIYDAIRPVKNKVYIMSGISLLVATLCIWLISLSFYRRADDIVKHMRRLENEEFGIIENGQESKDELGHLIRSVNQMSLKMKELIQNKYQMEIRNTKIELESRQAELNALQSQVNPHFMFNALEAIRFRSLVKDEKETAKMIKYMSKMFRKLITWNADWITVREEIEFIVEFLEIQKYRFDDELEFKIDVQEDSYGYKIPKMILQPLVENACIHGVEHVIGVRKIKVNVYAKEQFIYFSVIDNGIGIDEEKINLIIESIHDRSYDGMAVGLRNIMRRLILYYGEESEFNIESKSGEYTKITLVMPIKENDELQKMTR